MERTGGDAVCGTATGDPDGYMGCIETGRHTDLLDLHLQRRGEREERRMVDGVLRWVCAAGGL